MPLFLEALSSNLSIDDFKKLSVKLMVTNYIIKDILFYNSKNYSGAGIGLSWLSGRPDP